MPQVFLVSDTHFNHSRIREYEKAPENRDEMIMRNWQQVVKPKDLVIHLGDVIFGGSKRLAEVVSQLPGRKILVLGNHDNKSPQWYMDHGFDFACYEFKWKEFVFTHKPKQNIGDKINIHGHFHETLSHHSDEYPWYSENHKLVSLKENNYYPINLNEMKTEDKVQSGFKVYPKIHRLGKEETEGILDGVCYIQEKIDGANTSIWIEDGEIKCASRNQPITSGFNGFIDYVKSHEGIIKFLTKRPEHRLYGEWLVRHSISYNETAYKKFYLFDVMVGDEFQSIDKVYEIAEKYGIETPKLFSVIKNPTVDDIRPFVGQSVLGESGEGIVIKNFSFLNNFARREYAKWVTEKFKEDNAIIFGGNNKHSDTYWEMWITNTYCTLERVQKIMHKIEPTLDEKLDMKHIPRITSTVYHDILTEEIWSIAKKVKEIKFESLKRCIMKKTKQIYVDLLTNNLSVADL